MKKLYVLYWGMELARYAWSWVFPLTALNLSMEIDAFRTHLRAQVTFPQSELGGLTLDYPVFLRFHQGRVWVTRPSPPDWAMYALLPTTFQGSVKGRTLCAFASLANTHLEYCPFLSVCLDYFAHHSSQRWSQKRDILSCRRPEVFGDIDAVDSRGVGRKGGMQASLIAYATIQGERHHHSMEYTIIVCSNKLLTSLKTTP